MALLGGQTILFTTEFSNISLLPWPNMFVRVKCWNLFSFLFTYKSGYRWLDWSIKGNYQHVKHTLATSLMAKPHKWSACIQYWMSVGSRHHKPTFNEYKANIARVQNYPHITILNKAFGIEGRRYFHNLLHTKQFHLVPQPYWLPLMTINTAISLVDNPSERTSTEQYTNCMHKGKSFVRVNNLFEANVCPIVQFWSSEQTQ